MQWLLFALKWHQRFRFSTWWVGRYNPEGLANRLYWKLCQRLIISPRPEYPAVFGFKGPRFVLGSVSFFLHLYWFLLMWRGIFLFYRKVVSFAIHHNVKTFPILLGFLKSYSWVIINNNQSINNRGLFTSDVSNVSMLAADVPQAQMTSLFISNCFHSAIYVLTRKCGELSLLVPQSNVEQQRIWKGRSREQRKRTKRCWTTFWLCFRFLQALYLAEILQNSFWGLWLKQTLRHNQKSSLVVRLE